MVQEILKKHLSNTFASVYMASLIDHMYVHQQVYSWFVTVYFTGKLNETSS